MFLVVFLAAIYQRSTIGCWDYWWAGGELQRITGCI